MSIFVLPVVRFVATFVLAYVFSLAGSVAFGQSSLPDLTATPQAPYGPYRDGDAVSFWYTMNNIGTAPVASIGNNNWVQVDEYQDEANYSWHWIAPGQSGAIGGIPVGGSISVRSADWPSDDSSGVEFWCAVEGTHRVRMVADNVDAVTGDEVTESNESNNYSSWTTFTVNPALPEPDLVVEPVGTYGPYIEGQDVFFRFRYQNIGSVDATANTKARLQIDSGSGPYTSLYIGSKAPLAAGAANNYNSLKWVAGAPGTYRVRVVEVDPNDDTHEVSECNNYSEWVTFTVLSASTLTADLQLGADSFQVQSGATLTSILYSLRNIGAVGLDAHSYRILIDGVEVANSNAGGGIGPESDWQSYFGAINWTAPVVTDTTTISYEVQVNDPTDGWISVTRSIIVVPAPAGGVSISASRQVVRAGDPFDVNWTTGTANDCVLSIPGMSIDPYLSTSAMVTLDNTSVLRISCEGGLSEEVQVNVLANIFES